MHTSEYQFQLVYRPESRWRTAPIKTGWTLTALVLVFGIFWFRPGELQPGWRGFEGLEMIVLIYVPNLLCLVASALCRGARGRAVALALGGPLLLYSSALATFRNSWVDPGFSNIGLALSAEPDKTDGPRQQHPITCDCGTPYPEGSFKLVQNSPATRPSQVHQDVPQNTGPEAQSATEGARHASAAPLSNAKAKLRRLAKSAKTGVCDRVAIKPIKEAGTPGEANPRVRSYGVASDMHPVASAPHTPAPAARRSFLYSIFHWRRARSPTAFSGEVPASPRGHQQAAQP
jgi:hypothetical protein